jgi:hypothetical protein
LEDHLGIFNIEDLNVLDIGAGYGRLAHRMATALPNLKFYGCADAIAVSSFIAEYYLQYRHVDNKAQILPLDTIEDDLKNNSIDLALNIHSFSECTLSAIQWWMRLLQENQVPYLMIVPNSGTALLTQDGKDFRPLINQYGYEFMAVEPKYQDPVVQKYALNPDHFHLFKLK